VNATIDLSKFGEPIEQSEPLDLSKFGDPVETNAVDLSKFGDPETPEEDSGIWDDFQSVGRALQRGAYRADQAGNVIGAIGALAAGRDLELARKDLHDYDTQFLGKPDPLGIIKRNRLNKVSKIAQLEGEFANRQEQLPELAKNITQREADIQSVPLSPAQKEFQQGDWKKALRTNPIEVSASLMAESLPLAIPGMIAGTAASGAPGTAVGAGAGSFLAEYSTSILDALKAAKIDISKPGWEKSITEEQMENAILFAIKRGVPVSALDTFSGGVAGKVLKKALGKGIGKVIGASLLEGGIQGASDATGETLAQVASGQEFSPRDIVAEVAGGFPANVVEVAKNVYEARTSPTVEQPSPQPSTAVAPESQSVVQPQPNAPDLSEFGVNPKEAARPATVGDIRTILGEYMSESAQANLDRRLSEQEIVKPIEESDLIQEQNQQNAIEVTEDLTNDLQKAIQQNQLSEPTRTQERTEKTENVPLEPALLPNQMEPAKEDTSKPSEPTEPWYKLEDDTLDFNKWLSDTKGTKSNRLTPDQLSAAKQEFNALWKTEMTRPGKVSKAEIESELSKRGFGNVRVVSDPTQLPAPAYHGRARGVFWGGNTYVVANRHQTVQEAIETALHEAVGHEGVRAVLREDFRSTMRSVFRRYQNTPIGLKIADQYGLDLNDQNDQLELAEEVIAQLAESPQSDPTLWQRIVTAIKRAWRKLTNGDISEEEIRDLIRRAYNKQIHSNATNGDVRYSLGQEPKRSKREEAMAKIDELDKLKRAAKKAGNIKEVSRIEAEVRRISEQELGFKSKKKESEYLPSEEDVPQSDESSTQAPRTEPGPVPSSTFEYRGETDDIALEYPGLTRQQSGSTSTSIQDTIDAIQSSSANPTEDASKWLRGFRRQLRRLASAIPELPIFGKQAINRYAPFRRWYRQTFIATENARRRAEKDVSKIIKPIMDLGRKIHDPNTLKQFEALTNLINAEQEKQNPNSERINTLKSKRREMRNKIKDNPFWLFRNAVLWRDIAYRSTLLKTEEGGDITPPGGLSKEDTVEQAQSAMEAVRSSPYRDAIEESLRRHYKFVEDMQAELEAAGELIPDEMRNPNYYPHHILDKWTGKLSPVRATIDEPFRYYLQPLTGSEKLLQSDYIQAMYKHASDVYAHNAQMRLVEKELKPYDISKAHQEDLERRFGQDTPANAWEQERYLPKGYTFISPESLIPLSTSYAVDRNALAAQLGRTLEPGGDLLAELKRAGLDLRITANDLRRAMTVGSPKKWMVPIDVANALNGIKDREVAANLNKGNIVGSAAKTVQKAWKLNTLFNYFNWARYEYGNIATDVIDKMLGADPGSVLYFKQAMQEIVAHTRGDTSDTLESAINQGVISTVTASEADDIRELESFADTLSNAGRRWNRIKNALSVTVKASHLREATFRYSKYLADLDRIRQGERPVYAGAYWRDVEAQSSPEEKAGLIARKTFGDYGDIAVTGQFLRKYIFPFWSWTEVNLKYHANLFRNLYDFMKIGDITGAGRSARASAVAIALRLAAFRVGIELWNSIGGAMMGLWDDDDDLEGKLSEHDRRRLHIIMGKDDDGKVKLMHLPNALSDAAEWLGGNNFARLFMEWSKGDITFEEFASDFVKQMPADFSNKLAQSVRPELKFAYTMTSGKDPFPDVTNQRTIDRSQWAWILAQSMDRDATMALRSQIDPDYYAPESAGEWWQRKILQVRRRDPEQWAYYESRDKASDWKYEKTGKKNEGFDFKSPDATVLRNFRKSIYRGDVENAKRFYARALELGYTAERFQAAIRNSDPLSDLTKEERREYLDQLSPHDKQLLEFAFRYYARMANFKGDEKILFPKKGQRNFTPREDLLESTDGRLTEEEAQRLGNKLMNRR
jgi:hypothetical protein